MKTLILTPIIILLAIGCKKIDKKVEIIPNPKIEEKTPKAKALSYAIETKELLGKNLQEKMKQGGAENALEFCNVNAIPLTKQLEDQHNVTIKRVSDKNRNPDNAANAAELKIIEQFKTQLAKKEELKATMENGVFYAPITTNNMCLQCHGSEKDIKPETLAKIKSLYPNDNAIGYQENEMRGLMVIKPN